MKTKTLLFQHYYLMAKNYKMNRKINVLIGLVLHDKLIYTNKSRYLYQEISQVLTTQILTLSN